MCAARENRETKSRRGVVVVLVAVLLTVILGMAAVAVDGGTLLDNRRKAQGAADAAAMAAATALFSHYPSITSTNADPAGAGVAAGRASAASNGFSSSTRSIVTVNIPPATGPFAGRAGYAEVSINYAQPRYFSGIWSHTASSVVARSVARARWGGSGIGIQVLDPNSKDALNASGTGSVTVTGGAAVIVNSSNSVAAAATGGGGLTAPRFEITGGYTGSLNGTVETGVPPSPDPLRYLPVPTKPAAGTMTTQSLGHGNKRYTLSPGSYSNLPTFNTGDEVVLKQGGIIYIDGGGFKSTGANITMDSTTSGGVMIYNNPVSGALSQQIQITGNSAGTVNLSALTSGPYAGILMWQNRTATQQLAVSGGGSFSLLGTFYAANAQLTVSGNGNAVIGSQYISRTLNLGGGGSTFIQYSENGTARLREVVLVE